MNRDDPLELWLLRSMYDHTDELAAQQELIRRDLDQLEAWLDDISRTKYSKMPPVRGGRWSGNIWPAPEDVERIKALHRRVFEAGGSGKSYVEDALLGLIAATKDPAHIPFWVETSGLTRPRDSYANTRRTFALAALALIAIKREDPTALAALRAAAHHDNPQVRALAITYIGRVYQGYEDLIDLGDDSVEPSEDTPAGLDFSSLLGKAFVIEGAEDQIDSAAQTEEDEQEEDIPPRPVPPDIANELAAIAVHDKAFEPRFLARKILRIAGETVPMDNPGGVYAFKVKFMGAKRIYRTIALQSEQTLHELHIAIQQAIKWDDDHLYAFYMNGKLHDQRYAFASPWDRDAEAWVDQAVIGELGLALKHTFLYFFDYGDSHEFEVEVVDIRPHAESGDYPRVIDSQGKAPAQYWYEGEGEDEDEDEDQDEEVDEVE